MDSDITDDLELLLQRSLEQIRVKKQGLVSGREWFHVHDLLLAFVNGILRADPWYRGYQTPANFSEVVNYISSCIDKHFGKEIVINITPESYALSLRSWAMDNLNFRSWNISADAIFQNAEVYLRDLISNE